MIVLCIDVLLCLDRVHSQLHLSKLRSTSTSFSLSLAASLKLSCFPNMENFRLVLHGKLFFWLKNHFLCGRFYNRVGKFLSGIPHRNTDNSVFILCIGGAQLHKIL